MRFLGGTVAAGCLAALLVPAPAALARDVAVRSFDGTPIATHFFPAKGLQAGQRAPTVLVGHGWGQAGATSPEASGEEIFGSAGTGTFHNAGYNVLTWDARGFGASGGNAMVDHRDYEGRDVQALIDWLAKQPEAQLDAAGDPRVGMTGPSYGGGIQWVTAGIDGRVDAITPTISWNSLVRSLYRARNLKVGWGALLAAATGTTIPLGLVSPYGVQTGSFDPILVEMIVTALTTGGFSERQVGYFADRDIDLVIDKVRIPTLIVHGLVDTLFTPREAMDNFAALKGRGVPLKMVWFCGGHGLCGGQNGPDGYLDQVRLRWMNRWLKHDTGVDTGPVFEWLTDSDGKWHSAEVFPLAEREPIRATGSGQLPVNPLSFATGGGLLIAAGPASGAYELELPAAQGVADVIGEPKLRLSYSGSASPAQTHLYAQLVDPVRNRVVGNQVTPLPVTLDGKARELEVALEPVAAQLRDGERLKLQVAAGTTVYYPQRSTGSVQLSRVSLELPVVDPSVRPRLLLSKPRGLRRARRGRPGRVRVRGVLEGYRAVRVRLYRRGGKRWRQVGSSRRFAVGTAGKRVRLRVRRRLGKGRYLVRARATDMYGRPVSVARRARLR